MIRAILFPIGTEKKVLICYSHYWFCYRTVAYDVHQNELNTRTGNKKTLNGLY